MTLHHVLLAPTMEAHHFVGLVANFLFLKVRYVVTPHRHVKITLVSNMMAVCSHEPCVEVRLDVVDTISLSLIRLSSLGISSKVSTACTASVTKGLKIQLSMSSNHSTQRT